MLCLLLIFILIWGVQGIYRGRDGGGAAAAARGGGGGGASRESCMAGIRAKGGVATVTGGYGYLLRVIVCAASTVQWLQRPDHHGRETTTADGLD